MVQIIKINEINHKPYGHKFSYGDKIFDIDFIAIKAAIDENRLDKRGFQSNIDELKEYIFQTTDDKEIEKRYIAYHHEKIVYLVVNPPTDPIKVRVEIGIKTLVDGQHRLWAAKYSGRTEIEAEII